MATEQQFNDMIIHNLLKVSVYISDANCADQLGYGIIFCFVSYRKP